MLNVLVEGERRGQSADAGNLQSWVKQHSVDLPSAMDGDGALASLVGEVPAYAIVDASTMRIRALVRVSAEASPQRAVAIALEGSSDGEDVSRAFLQTRELTGESRYIGRRKVTFRMRPALSIFMERVRNTVYFLFLFFFFRCTPEMTSQAF